MPIRKYLGFIKNFDWVLLAAVFLLVAFSLAALYSIALSSEQPDFSNFYKQLIFAVIGLIFIFIISLIDYRMWQDFSLILYGAAALLLLLVLFFGTTLRGTTGWFVILGFGFQPVEIAKIGLIGYLSWFLSRHVSEIKKFDIFIKTGLSAALFFLLVVLQPDFGSAVIVFFIWLLMMLFSGMNKKHLLILILTILVSFTIAWIFLFKDYQKDRILTFINPQADPYGRGYQVRQAITAIGAGGLTGRGLGFGSQSQLKFLPASQTDFIFAVIAEELGFFGVAMILFFWFLIFLRLLRAARLMKDSFALFFVLGVSAMFFIHIMINIGMNIGLVPVTGISLPFMSYGGSFLLASLVLVGIIQSMIIRNQTSAI